MLNCYTDVNETLDLMATVFNVKSTEIKKIPYQTHDGLIGYYEASESTNVTLYDLKSKKVVCKSKPKNIIIKLEKALNLLNDENFTELWLKAHHIFFIRDNYTRDIKIYKGLDRSLQKYLPHYFGGVYDEARSVFFIEYVGNNGIDDKNDINRIIEFLAALHKAYYNEENLAAEIGANIFKASDFTESHSLVSKLLGHVKKAYPSFPEDILKHGESSLNNFDTYWDTMLRFGQTLCHGDFATKNTKLFSGQLKVYDWELSSYINPEYDLITYLTHVQHEIDNDYISAVIKLYFENVDFREDYDEFIKCLVFNVDFYFLTRLLPVLILNLSAHFNYYPLVIKNFVNLYRFFVKQA